ncbi:transglutaminase TgpA family protein [Propionivibrio sp.]|uniref:transglutaminase TgpA family protein n=1 Tax=Propionivibrio sp. TaxID=2212460 RepID=UPI0039E512F6
MTASVARRPAPAGLPLAALLGLMVAAHAPALPWAAWPVLLLAAASRRLPATRTAAALRVAALLGVYAAAALAWGWFAAATLRLALLAALLLKWAESRSAAEDALVAAAALVAVAVGSLNWSEAGALAWIAPALPCALAALGAPETDPVPGRRPAPRLKTALRVLRMPLRHLAAALPLAGVLFVFFPRIPGPLWDIGLSFGLPLAIGIDQSPAGLGVAATLKPGQTQAGAAMAASTPVLVAEFENWVPPTAQLYWRGPVFYDFDGREWSLDADIATNGRRFMQKGWRSARAFGEEQLAQKAQEVRYTIRLSPHKATWLYALDLPAALPTEAFVAPDWQVISHTPVAREMTYGLASWLEWTARPEIAPDLRERALALPAAGNPRLRRLGGELRELRAAGEADADAIVRAALARIAEGGYTLRDRFEAPPEADAFDAFWFDTRAGNAEFFAGAFVYLMRAAGVPARLVTGYRGGKLMALTNYVVVKRSHAHAWAEVWDGRRGWRRIDPVDIVALQKRVETGPQARERAEPAATAPAPREEGRKNAAPRPLPNGDFAERAPAAQLRLQPSDDAPSWLDALGDWIGRWIVRLDAERQLELLAGKGGGFAWVWLLLGAVFAAATLAGAALGLARWRDARRLPPAQRAWRRACALLARHGLPLAPTECPRDYARRVGRARPELAVGIQTLADAYCGWRYGPVPERWPATVAQAARYLMNLIQAMPAPRPAGKTTETKKQ